MENFRLQVFRTVAQQMSFRRAAEVLHLSQPAVSQQIKLLEEESGARLFDRDAGQPGQQGSQIALTEAGRILLGYAGRAAELMEEAVKELAALRSEVAGPLRLGASTTIAQYVLPRILGAFVREFPRIELALESGNTQKVVEAVLEGRIALGMIEGPAMRRGLKVELMIEDEMVLIAAPSAGARKSITLERLAAMPLLMRERGSGSRRVVERALAAAGLPVKRLRVALELDSTEAIVSGVEAGLGAGFVSRCAIGKELRLGTLQIVEIEGLRVGREFSFVRLAGAELTGAAKAFHRFASVKG